MSAILFGSISTVADTSELQRQAFNQAFQAHGLDWNWDRDQYRSMLGKAGGKNRIAEYADSVGQSVDAAGVHETKSRIFQENLAKTPLQPRDGVVDTIAAAKSNGWKLGLVTTTSPDNISALLGALSPGITAADFDVIVDSTKVNQPKPDRAAYSYALESLSEAADGCVAIEDNVDGISAANAAGLPVVAFPNANTVDDDVSAAAVRVDRLDADELQQLAGSQSRG